jgi:hypothetical protein
VDAASGPAAALELVQAPGTLADGSTSGAVARFRFTVATGTTAQYVQSDADVDEGWYRIAAIVSPGTGQIGLTVWDPNASDPAGDFTDLDPAKGALASPAGALRLSPSAPSTPVMPVARWDGVIDEVRVFRGALTGTLDEVSQVDSELSAWLSKTRSSAATDTTCGTTAPAR